MRKPKSQRTKIDRQFIEKVANLHIEEGLSTFEIWQKLQCAPMSVHRALRAAGITAKGAQSGRFGRGKGPLVMHGCGEFERAVALRKKFLSPSAVGKETK